MYDLLLKGGTVFDSQAGPGIHARLGPASLGLGARPGSAGGGGHWGVLLSGEGL